MTMTPESIGNRFSSRNPPMPLAYDARCVMMRGWPRHQFCGCLDSTGSRLVYDVLCDPSVRACGAFALGAGTELR